MGATGGFREWLTKGKVAPREAFFTDEVSFTPFSLAFFEFSNAKPE